MDVAPLVALEEESRALSTVLSAIDDQDFERSTNCPPWNLRDLVVHIADSLRLPAAWPSASADVPLKSAADYYRRDERNTAAYRQRNVEDAQQSARRLPAAADAASYLGQAAFLVIERLEGQDLRRLVKVPKVGAMRLSDYVATRVMSVAAHGLDVAITLERTSWTTPPALATARGILVSLLGSEPPRCPRLGRPAATGSGNRQTTPARR